MGTAEGRHALQRHHRRSHPVTPGSSDERLYFAGMLHGARKIAAKLSVGGKLTRAEVQWLAGRPETVRRAVKACARKRSRYLPLGIGAAPPRVGSSEEELNEYRKKTLPDVTRAEEQGDPKALRKARLKSYDVPKNVPGFGRVVNAIAVCAGRAPKTLYAWERDQLSKVEEENRLNRQRQVDERYLQQERELQSLGRKEDLDKLRRDKEREDRYWMAHDAYRRKGNPAYRTRARTRS